MVTILGHFGLKNESPEVRAIVVLTDKNPLMKVIPKELLSQVS